ncbi:MAG TPA: molybdopterin cofactor-binding domain-containing protein, partial [Allosphingosinicella sp.]|nr:molybdopterin cofactor-binding domain-containing protein [Allosphingosinicella sp.]
MARDAEARGISRRTLLIGGGAGVGLLVAWKFWPRSYAPNLRAAEDETIYNAFLKIGRDGRVIVAVPQTEIGQGVYTSLPQILADELGADWRTVSVEPAPVSPLYANRLLAGEAADDSGLPGFLHGVGRWAARDYATKSALMLTAGSTSVRAFEAPLREAGAGARALLSIAAANRWNVGWEELDTRAGFVWGPEGRIPFAELAEAAAGLDLPTHLPVRG